MTLWTVRRLVNIESILRSPHIATRKVRVIGCTGCSSRSYRMTVNSNNERLPQKVSNYFKGLTSRSACPHSGSKHRQSDGRPKLVQRSKSTYTAADMDSRNRSLQLPALESSLALNMSSKVPLAHSYISQIKALSNYLQSTTIPMATLS